MGSAIPATKGSTVSTIKVLLFLPLRARRSLPHSAFAAEHVTKSSVEPFSPSSDRSFSNITEWLSKLHDAKPFPWWVIYLKVAVPRPGTGLHILLYLGSATRTKTGKTGGGKTGGKARIENHVTTLKKTCASRGTSSTAGGS